MTTTPGDEQQLPCCTAMHIVHICWSDSNGASNDAFSGKQEMVQAMVLSSSMVSILMLIAACTAVGAAVCLSIWTHLCGNRLWL
jgi:hypothetical protein